MSCAWTVFTLGLGSGRGLSTPCVFQSKEKGEICICNDSLLFLSVDFSFQKKSGLVWKEQMYLRITVFYILHQFLKYTGLILTWRISSAIAALLWHQCLSICLLNSSPGYGLVTVTMTKVYVWYFKVEIYCNLKGKRPNLLLKKLEKPSIMNRL